MEELLAELKDIIQSTDVAMDNLSDAIIARKRVEDSVKYVKDSLAKLSLVAASDAAKESLSSARSLAPSIYSKRVKAAATASVEYAYNAFLSPLLEIADNEDLYDLKLTGNGWNTSVVVKLNMNEIAGDIDDYAEAVELARSSLHVKEERDPDTASRYWKTKVYPDRAGRYAETINLRLLASSSPAPFWSLLNYGSKNVSMSSDIGGSPYPSKGGHRFVEQTENEIKDFFYLNFTLAKYHFDKDKEVLLSYIDEAKNLIAKLDADIEKLSSNSDLLDAIGKAIGVDVSRLNASKIIIAAQQVKAGGRLPAQVRVGQGDLRIRAKKFSSLVMEYGE